MLAPTAFLIPLTMWDRDVIFLIPLTFIASVFVGGLSAAGDSSRQWGLHGLIAGVVALAASIFAIFRMVD
ncbi:hypothetical protein GRI89_12965 [Altererythrobacter salegens]|uniref:Uncharacterized protein n=1 Tax=Croceibacterium salegens TaxID=1737568 RepID=A0A6I4SYK2_9SPHN|nr:hypothetical protein [Croceibacterium salegens]MXO60449.1 hypothetical protein [Croceibacterium salegens]